MSAIFIFEIKSAKKDKIFNFLKGRFFIMGGPMDMNFWRVFRSLCKTSKKYNFAIFLKIQQKL